MADTFKSLNDLITLNDKNAVDYGCSDLLQEAPLIQRLAATVSSNGTQHKYLKQTGDAGSAFRSVNTGVDNTVSSDTLVSIDLKILAASFAVDKAMADEWYKGADAFVAREAQRKLKSALAKAEKQVINGTVGGDAAGFNGLANVSTMNTASGSMVINAGGTSANTGSSVYLIRTNDDGCDVEVVVGNEGDIEVGETFITRLTDSNGKSYPGYYTPVEGWMALQLGSTYSAARIGNLTADSGKGLTDALISSALALFPPERRPNLIVMSGRSLAQLQKSRTSYSPTGAPAEIPDSAFNIPIVISSGVLNTEALLA